MADIQKVLEQAKEDATAIAVPIFQRNGKPYLASDGTRSTISVIGSESKEYRDKREAFYRDRAKEAEGTEPDAAQDRIALAALAVKGWHGWESKDVPVECTESNVHALFTMEHILYQVEQGIARRADFFGGSSAS